MLAFVYTRLAIGEEREVLEAFGPEGEAYDAHTPRFIAHWSRPQAVSPQ